MENDILSEKIREQYQTEVRDALEKCQFVEETLRVYISLAIDIASKKLGNVFPIRFTESDLSKLSLGKLAAIFSRLTDNTSLKSSLHKITTERNYVVHRSLLFAIGELHDPIKLSESAKKMESIKKRAKDVHEELLAETWRLRKERSALRRHRKSPSP